MDALHAVGDPELRKALLLARRSERPVTADDVAEALGVHRNVARSRLERLVSAGLLEPVYERRTGRSGPGAGRPAKTYAVVPELRAIEFPERRYEALVGLLIDALPEGERAVALRRVGGEFGDELAEAAGLRPAATVGASAEALCAALRRLGYQALVAGVDGDRVEIVTATCPLRPLVRARPKAAGVDRGLWAALAAHATNTVGAAGIDCETRGCLADDASCRVVLHLRISKD